jgi:hypothetical protein
MFNKASRQNKLILTTASLKWMLNIFDSSWPSVPETGSTKENFNITGWRRTCHEVYANMSMNLIFHKAVVMEVFSFAQGTA